MNPFKRSILRRLLVMQLAVLALFLIAQVSLTYYAAMQFDRGDFDRELMFSAEMLAKLGERDVHDVTDLGLTAHIFEQLSEAGIDAEGWSSYEQAFQLWSASGELLFRTDKAPVSALATLRPGFARVTLAGKTWRVATARSPNGLLYAQMAESYDMRAEMLNLIYVIFLQPLLVLALLLVASTWIAAVGGLRPLSALARQINARSADDLARVSSTPEYSETRPLVNAINELIERIEQTLGRERNFLADAAHELRTPIAALQAQLHVLVHSQTAAERDTAAAEMRGAITRASALLKQLLVIARLESASGQLTFERVDLAALVQQRLAGIGKAAILKSIELELDAPARCDAVVDRDSITSLIDNLVDNAVRYVPAGGRVSVKLSQLDDDTELQVADNGPGIPSEQRERVFERFCRLPDHDEPGSGLGLAIARRAVLLHRGQIRLREGIDDRGVTVEVRFPSMSEQPR